jgi:hypothetical protein
VVELLLCTVTAPEVIYKRKLGGVLEELARNMFSSSRTLPG